MQAVFTTPPSNDRSPRYMEKALAAIHQALTPRDTVCLHYMTDNERLILALSFPDHLQQSVLGPLVANYPKARVEPREVSQFQTSEAISLTMRLSPDLFPMLRHGQFEDMLLHAYADPIDSLLHALRPDPEVRCRLELRITPATPYRCRRARRALALLERAFFARHKRMAAWFVRRCTDESFSLASWIVARLARRSAAPDRGAPLDVTSGYRHEREADLQAAAEKLGGHLFSAELHITAEGSDANHVRARLHAVAGSLGAFTRSRLATYKIVPARCQPRARSFLLSHEEVATLWHPPTAGVQAERMQTSDFVELEAPPHLPSEEEKGAILLGTTAYRTDRRMVAIRREDRRRHMHVIGRTGVGKTTLLLSQIHNDILRGEGVGLCDPHGDLADSVLRLIPRHRTNDVVIFDAADPTHAIGFNPLACPDLRRIDQVTSAAVSALKKLHDSWGPRLENLLRNAVHVTVEQRGTLLTLLRLLTDDAFRERIVPQISDEVVRAFWEQEFASWTRPYRIEAVAAITNKIQPFLTNASVRAIVSQADRSLDIRRLMDDGKILIANLSKGKIGEDNSALLGAFLVSAIQQAAMTRADLPEESRKDFYLYIDEFQNFVTTSFETILSEARKYRLNLTVSHQYRAQLTDTTAAAIAGNVGTIVSFAVGSDDAEWIARAIGTRPGQLSPQDLANLPKFTAYVRPLLDGVPIAPFSITTSPPPQAVEDRSDTILAHSRRQFSRRRDPAPPPVKSPP